MGYGQVMICGGTESSIHPLALAGFARARSVVTDSEFNSNPTKASRPFDKSRNGFVLSEGCGILVLETLSHALEEELHLIKFMGKFLGMVFLVMRII